MTAVTRDGRRFRPMPSSAATASSRWCARSCIGDAPRVSGHVVYRAVVPAADMPEDLRWNAPVVWAGPNCHLVHYPLRHGEQYNLVVTFHSRDDEEWGVTDGSKEEVLSYFEGIARAPAPAAGPAHLLAPLEHRRPRPGRELEPRPRHAAGRCGASDDAVPRAGRLHGARRRGDAGRGRRGLRLRPARAPSSCYAAARVARTARVVLSVREMGRLYHAKGVERLVRNEPVDRPHARALLRRGRMALRVEPRSTAWTTHA